MALSNKIILGCSLFALVALQSVKSQDFENLDQILNDSIWRMNNFDFNQPLKSQLLPLDSILLIAIDNNPQIAAEEAYVAQASSNVKNTKKLWMNNIYGTAGYNGGNQSIIFNSADEFDQTNNLTNGYRWGLNVRLPLYEVFGRKDQVNMMKAQLKASQNQLEVAELRLQQNVIEAYFNLLNSQELLKSRGEDHQTQQSNLELARVAMLKGDIEMDEYSRVYTLATNSEAFYLESKQRFYTAFFMFETVVGVDINFLKR